MRSLSKSFKKELNNDNRRYLEWVDITLKDGTALYLREDSVWNFGLKVEDAVSDSSEFKIGSAIINKATVTLNNIYDDFTDYDFEGAEIAIYVGLAISPTGMVFPEEKKWLDISENPILDTNGNEILLLYSDAVTEKIRLCTMTVVEAPYQNSSIITLTCQDNMMKFDRDYSESKLKYPATRSEIIRDACNVCGVQLQTVTFDNDDYVIETRPDDQQLTFRQVLAWVAQIGGQFCRCDSYGRLCIAWYDLKSYESSHIDEDKFVSVESYDSLSINNEDVVITGIKVTEYKENVSTDESPVSYQYGEDGYVIEIKDNKLIAEGKGNDIATIIGKRIVGMRFRPFSASMMNNPLAEAGDICIITDRKGNQYKSLVTSTIFQVGNKQTIECGAKSAARNSAKQYSLASQAIVENRKNLQKERSDREKALEELSNRISQSSGLYTTVEESQGGGKVYYLHNKALLSDSDIVWKMTAEAWGVSTDGGNTWNGGMTVDGDTVVRILDAVGVRANWINTGEFKVADEKGNEVFYVNCDTGSVRIKAQEFSLSGVSIEEIAAKKVDDFVTNIYKTDMDEIKNSVRNKIETWYQDSDPSVNWKDKTEHEGDLWKDTRDNKEYIYRSGQWVEMNVPDEVFDEIDSKAQIFINEPITPYKIGDLWFDSETKELLTCIKSRATGSCVKADWEKRTKYTDDSTVNTFITKIYESDIDDIRNQIDQKIETWYQSTDPSVNWGGTVEKALCDIDGNSILDVNGNEIILLYEESKAEHEGDLWKDLSTNDEYIYRGGQWMKMQVPDEVFDEIDGKAQIFINTPVPPYRVGDLWFDADTQELLTCVESRDKGSCVKSDWQKKTKYTDDSGLNTFISAVYDPKIAELQSQIDGQIETWFYDHEPSLQNEPAVNWTTNEQRKDHEGDLFFWKSTGYSYRFLQDGAVWKWQIVQDTDISKALAAAEKAQDTADHKRRVFVVTPQPPYDIGDLWVQGDDGDIMRCCVARSESASFSASDWEKASKYTDDTRANEVQKELETVNKDLQNQIDGKIETYNQSADPAASWTTAELKAKHTGDLWYNSKTEETMRWNGSAWSKLSDADAKAAKNLAVTKKRVFSVTPYPPYDTDDLWVQGTNGDLMRCVTSRQSGEYVASDWVKATKYTDDSAVDKLNKSLTSEEVFNRLTDNGKKQGIYMQGDQLYINFSYGKGGTLTLGGVNNENGSIQILDAIGAEVGKWDKDGLNIQKGSIYGSTIYLDKEKAYALIVGRNNSKEIFTIGSMGMHIDNTNMGLLASDSMVVDLMGGWFHGLRMKASNNGRGYGSSISPECFSIGWAEDLQGWSDAMSTVKSYTFSISENSTGCLSIRINGSSYINDYVDISPREIKTTGTKNRVVPTENYSNRLQYCYETASPMFGDIGEGITDENGECIVEIGDIFTETVTTRIEYQVFLQKEGKGDLWIEKKEENYFIVHGTPNLKFAWELKAKQKDYEYVNLEEDVDREEKLPESPENILNAELETLIKEQEELLNETA